MRYVAPKDVKVSGSNAKGAEVGPIEFKKGFYETKKADEIALLDACATDPDNPIGFDPKESPKEE